MAKRILVERKNMTKKEDKNFGKKLTKHEHDVVKFTKNFIKRYRKTLEALAKQ